MSAQTETPKWLDVAEAARRSGLSLRKIYELCSREVIGHYRHDAAIRIPEAEFDAYMARTYVPARNPEAAA